MELADKLAERHADLQTRIDAARQRLAENSKMEWAEIGNLLEGLSLELDEMDGDDPDTRHRAYDRVEGEVSKIHARLDTARPTD